VAIIPDTLQGAIVLSVFDFIACFFVLWGISFFIKALGIVDKKLLKNADNKAS
jgi:hypothetical protein